MTERPRGYRIRRGVPAGRVIRIDAEVEAYVLARRRPDESKQAALSRLVREAIAREEEPA